MRIVNRRVDSYGCEDVTRFIETREVLRQAERCHAGPALTEHKINASKDARFSSTVWAHQRGHRLKMDFNVIKTSKSPKLGHCQHSRVPQKPRTWSATSEPVPTPSLFQKAHPTRASELLQAEVRTRFAAVLQPVAVVGSVAGGGDSHDLA